MLTFSFRAGLRLVVLAGLVLLAQAVRAQAPPWQMALAIDAPTGGASAVSATAVDAAGNVFLTGWFSGTAHFDSLAISCGAGSSREAFVAKWSPAAGFVWVQRGGAGSAGTALAVRDGSVYVAGVYEGLTASFGSTTLTNAGSPASDVFVAKLADTGSAGAWVWARSAGGPRPDEATALAVSGSSLYLTGSFASATIGFGGQVLTNAGGRLPGDVFVAKLTDEGSSGAWGWALRAGGLAYERANALAVKDGRVYVGGYFDGPTAAFGGATLTSSGNRDAFVARITDGGTAGQWTWAQKADGLGAEVVTALAVGSGGVYVAGHFNGPTAGFGAVALTSEGIMDGFVAKLTDQGSSGAWGWVQQVGGRGADVPQAVTVDGGTLYVAGYITSDSARFGPTVLVKAGAAGLFVAALADGGATGAWAWGQQGGGAGDDRAVTLARHGSTLYVGGSAGSRTVRFGSHAVTKGGTGPDYSSGFLAALGETPPVVPGEEGCGPLTLWPNPAHDSVRLGGAVTGPLHVVDAVGRLVRTLTLEAKAAGQDSRVLDLRGLPVGVYVLRTGCQQKRLVVD